jgi:hypothetical protein
MNVQFEEDSEKALPVGKERMTWQDRVTYLVLHREAQALISGSP